MVIRRKGSGTFVSLKWKLLLTLLLTLSLVYALAQALSYSQQQQELEAELSARNQQQLDMLNATVESSYRRLLDIAQLLLLPPHGESEAAHSGGRVLQLARTMDARAGEALMLGVVDLVQLYGVDGHLQRAWGTALDIRPEVILQVLEREQPQRSIACVQDCLRYVAIPLMLSGGETVVLLVGSPMLDVVLEYHRQSSGDIGLMLASPEQGDGQPWRLVALTNRDRYAGLLASLSLAVARENPAVPLRLRHEGRELQLQLAPLQKDVSDTRAYWVILSDITAPLEAMRERRLFDITVALAGIVLALALLALMLRRPLGYLGRLAEQLPQLASVGGQRRQQLQRLPARLGSRALPDELDVLAGSAVELASRLDELEETVADHTLHLERRSAALQRERDFVTSLFDTAEAVILTQDRDGVIQSLNQHGCRLLGLPLPSVPGCRFDAIGLLDESEDAVVQLSSLYAGESRRVQLDTRFMSADGRELHLSWQHSRLRGTEDHDATILSIGLDMTERRHAESRLYWLANHDPLTRLPNRQLFFEALVQTIKSAAQSGRELALLCCDIDDFKGVNDSLGHHVGDQLLQAVALRLGEAGSEEHLLARLGADEFVLMLECDQDAMAASTGLARRLIGSFVEPFHLNGYEIYSTLSIGISLFPEHGRDATDLVKSADLAMIEAKEQGSGRYGVYHTAQGSVRVERFALGNELRRATDRGDFSLQYQPKVDALSGRVCGMEALVRWQHPEFGAVSPGRFIPLAEEMGLIVPLGRWVLNEACRQMAQWQQAGMIPIRMGVNLAGPQIAHERLLQEVDEALAQAGLPASLLDLEITENFVIRQPELTVSKLTQLRERGISLSMDDFGTGYSSLSYLKRLPINTLKIDQSFVRDIGQDRDDEAIVKAIIVMCRSLGIGVLAEGVETSEQLDFLLRHGCHHIQGYYYSRPLDPPALWDFVDQHGMAGSC
ncbi:bifunctional diguanylate cyclase/phosphodiesterase [Marinobacterium rhizophilum]|uniref:EAL domain-containing protein n=1 Tax=Marinobacterium rhizophilum TaxID=420402 RepID=A0ABY5HLF7_9GAMM|nr:EAL domain-containing protein [Marinobacterium rhizophilum]UTW12423.1 EAL domain-containing protein [Marinobacterium rhizophilum]